jgi:hypothetical protein
MANDSIDTLAALLGDKSAAWVNRRDAADGLARAIQRATAALRAHTEDKDADVKIAVNQALNRLSGAATTASVNAAPAPPPLAVDLPPTLAELVQACAKPGERDVTAVGDGFTIIVNHKSGRKQTVYVKTVERDDGLRIVQVYSPCGGAKESFYAWVLKANTRLVQSAIAISEGEGGESFCLMRTFLDGQITKPEMHAAIKEIAYYADWIEHKMTGQDAL